LSLRRNDPAGNGEISDNSEATQWRQLQIDWSGRQHLLRNWLTDETHVKHLLRVLFDHTPSRDSDCYLLIDTIAREMSTSRRTAQRTVKRAVEEGLIIIFGPKSRRRCNTYRLRLANIFERAEAELKGANLAPQPCQADTPDVPTCHPKGANLAHGSTLEVPTEPPPPKRGAGTTPAAHPTDEWGVAVEELIDYGVGDPEPAVEKARQRGCSAPFVRRIIDYALSQVAGDGTCAWGGGALRKRILNLRPGQPIDDETLWLSVDPAYKQARRREAEQNQEDERRRQNARRKESAQADL
jgi:hypothetical protein